MSLHFLDRDAIGVHDSPRTGIVFANENHARPLKQIEALRDYRNKVGVNKAIRDLISRHAPGDSSSAPDLHNLIRRLSGLGADDSTSIAVSVIRASGKALLVTEELLQSLPPYQEARPTCTAGNR
jgi:hypothetical protein